MSIPLTLGILAHVDAGKTTLSEALLYQSGAIRRAGRVDHRDTFLDTNAMERDRGITIFSKQARFTLSAGGQNVQEAPVREVTLLDTPGHVDFSAETERTLQVLDLAVLVISGTDGVQSHTRTLWRLLNHYQVPVFLFVNKMDLAGADRERVLSELKKELSDGCVAFPEDGVMDEAMYEEIAMTGDAALEYYSENGFLPTDMIREAIAGRHLFPVWFGSALKMEGVESLAGGIALWAPLTEYGPDFGARVYKIGRDPKGERLTYLKITGGTLHVKDLVRIGGDGSGLGEAAGMTQGEMVSDSGKALPSEAASGSGKGLPGEASAQVPSEKVDQIRLYSGDKYELVQEACAGMVAAVTGLASTKSGMGLGTERDTVHPVLEAVMTRAMILPPDISQASFYRQVRELEEEDPALRIVWDEKTKEIQAQIMGQVQIEILTRLIEERFGVKVSFGPERVLYKETIVSPVEGVGHFEPLRHYAEVHLLLEPGDPGSGVTVSSACSTDVLDLNWQRLIAIHVLEREHPGVLIGAPLSDVKITILTGRAHVKHTEGGDFRQATYRAIRQGLMMAECVLLEPYLTIRLELPSDSLGRALNDLNARFARLEDPVFRDDGSVLLTGKIPAACVGEYAAEVHSYTRGAGILSLTPAGYGLCHNAEEVMEASHYDPEADTENPPGSVFCSHGSGFLVPWDQVPSYMHLDWVFGGGWIPAANASPGGDYDRDVQGSADGPGAGNISTGGAYAKGARGSADGPGAGGALTDAAYKGNGVSADEAGGGPGYLAGTWADYESRGVSRAAERAVREAGRRDATPENDPELQAIYAREFGMTKEGMRFDAEERSRRSWKKNSTPRIDGPREKIDKHGNPIFPKKDERKPFLIVDGYNMIYAWEELKLLSRDSLDAARGRLLDMLANYQGFTGERLAVVFDAYRTDRTPASVTRWNNLEVVFTQKGETADAWIERCVHEEGGKYRITVATSDGLEQLTVLRLGALRLTARELMGRVRDMSLQK